MCQHTYKQTNTTRTQTNACTEASHIPRHRQTDTGTHTQAQPRIGPTCNASPSHTQTQARARTHAREPRTPTPARGRPATAGRPRRRLHPALPRQLARAAALDRAAPSWGPRSHPLAKTVGPFLFFARGKQGRLSPSPSSPSSPFPPAYNPHALQEPCEPPLPAQRSAPPCIARPPRAGCRDPGRPPPRERRASGGSDGGRRRGREAAEGFCCSCGGGRCGGTHLARLRSRAEHAKDECPDLNDDCTRCPALQCHQRRRRGVVAASRGDAGPGRGGCESRGEMTCMCRCGVVDAACTRDQPSGAQATP